MMHFDRFNDDAQRKIQKIDDLRGLELFAFFRKTNQVEKKIVNSRCSFGNRKRP